MTSNHQRVDMTTPPTAQPSRMARCNSVEGPIQVCDKHEEYVACVQCLTAHISRSDHDKNIIEWGGGGEGGVMGGPHITKIPTYFTSQIPGPKFIYPSNPKSQMILPLKSKNKCTPQIPNPKMVTQYYQNIKH